jgi:L-asparagine transporter-like permease
MASESNPKGQANQVLENGLRRELSAWDTTSIIVGVIIGVGIFMGVPSLVAQKVPSAPGS